MERIIGIDLGTCNSCVAAVVGRKAVALAQDNRTTVPTVFAMSNGQEIVGFEAKMQIVSNPFQTIHGIKRILGRTFDSPQVRHAREAVSYDIIQGSAGEVRVRVEHLEFTPVQIAGRILAHLKELAEADLQQPVRRAVIAVPAHFGDAQRTAIKQAAELAGLEVLRLLNEPTASALAYSLQGWGKRRIAVFDLGGGTFDFTLMDVHDRFFEARATDGDSYLGGTDFDYEIVRWLVEQFQEKEGVNLALDRTALLRLKLAAERAKIELSEKQEAFIDLPAIATATRGGTHLRETLTRDRVEQLCRPYVVRCLEICERTIAAAKTWVNEIDEIVLVGGQTRMPLVERAVRDFFGKEPRKDVVGDEVVAIGSAAQAFALSAAVPDQGEGQAQSRPRVEGTPKPGRASVDADADILLLDVLPMTIGLAGPDGEFIPLLLRNETLPAEKRHVVTTPTSDTGKVRLKVVQGECDRAADNTPVGELVVEGVQEDADGQARIDVQFRVDASGMIQVRAWDRVSGARSAVTLEYGLPELDSRRR